jgi:hypothetical protein
VRRASAGPSGIQSGRSYDRADCTPRSREATSLCWIQRPTPVPRAMGHRWRALKPDGECSSNQERLALASSALADSNVMPPWVITVEVLNVNPRHKNAIILLLYHNSIKVLKDALAHLGQYQTLTEVWYSDPGG